MRHVISVYVELLCEICATNGERIGEEKLVTCNWTGKNESGQ